MLPIYQDPCFTFRFTDDRSIDRFHLEGVDVEEQVKVFKIDPQTGERLGLLATAIAAEGGWVALSKAIIVKAGQGFVVVRDRNNGEGTAQ